MAPVAICRTSMGSTATHSYIEPWEPPAITEEIERLLTDAGVSLKGRFNAHPQ
jgi:hypothetical protein